MTGSPYDEAEHEVQALVQIRDKQMRWLRDSNFVGEDEVVTVAEAVSSDFPGEVRISDIGQLVDEWGDVSLTAELAHELGQALIAAATNDRPR